MINIIVKRNEIFLEINNNYHYYKILELEKEFEDIMYECEIKNNEKIFLILDFEANDLEYYNTIFSYYNLKLKKAIKFLDILKNTKEEYIYLGENSSLNIKGEKVDNIDVKLSDNFDFSGVKTININRDNIEEIFDIIKKGKAPNILNKTISYKNTVYIAISVLIILISNLVISLAYNTKSLDNKNSINLNKISKLKNHIDIEKIYNKKLEKQILENEDIKDINEFIEKKEYYSLIKKILDASQKGIYFKTITYVDKRLVLEGIASDYSSMMKIFNDYKIEYLLSSNDNVGFKVSKEVKNE